MIRLQGGPYYELSFLARNQEDKKGVVENILSKLIQKTQFKVINDKEALIERIKLFVDGEQHEGDVVRSLDIDTQIEISGERKSRLFIAELSDELLKINFWFYGSQYDAIEWDQIGLKEIDKPGFRKFFDDVKEVLNPMLGTIAYEEDCSALFDSDYTWPNNYFKIKNLSLEKINKRLHRNVNEFEYCWINGHIFDLEQNIEIKMQTI